MPWYEVPLTVFLPADSAEEARERVLGWLPAVGDDDESRPMATAVYPSELSPQRADAVVRLREVLRQAEKDASGGDMVADPRYPGLKFSPQAAAELAALEFEQQGDSL